MNYRQRWTKFIQYSYLSNRPFMHFFSFSENTIKCTPFFGFNSIVEEKMHIVFLFKLQFITINNSRTFWDLDKAWRGMRIYPQLLIKKILIYFWYFLNDFAILRPWWCILYTRTSHAFKYYISYYSINLFKKRRYKIYKIK